MTGSTMDRMRLIRGHLEATSRGRSPGAEQIGVWIRELQAIPDEGLDAAIREARAYHVEACDRGRRWGRMTPDDVLAMWRQRTQRDRGADEPPESPGCPRGCERGIARLIGSDGYDFVTRCDCPSGDWLAQYSSRWAASTPAGEFLANPAFKLAEEPRAPLPPSHVEWLQKRSEQVGGARAAEEYRAHVKKQNRGASIQSSSE